MEQDYSLRSALQTQQGEQQPRVSVSREGKPISYEQLEKMTVKELSGCIITSFGEPVRLSPSGSFAGGPGKAQSSVDTRQNAANALESIYQLGCAILSSM